MITMILCNRLFNSIIYVIRGCQMAHENTILFDKFIEHHKAAYAEDPELSVIFNAMLNSDITLSAPTYSAAGAASVTLETAELSAPEQTYVKADVETSPEFWTLANPVALTDELEIANLTETGLYLLTTLGVTKVIAVVMTTVATVVNDEVLALLAAKAKYTTDVLPTVTGTRVGWASESAAVSIFGELDIHEVAKDLVVPDADLGQLEAPEVV